MFSRFKNWFYRGPADLGLQLKGKRGYQSPTVTAIAWVAALAVRHLTMAGRVTALCCMLLIPYAMVTPNMPIYMLAFSAFMLFVVDFCVGWFFRPKLLMARAFPERVAEGAEITVMYTLTNAGKRAVTGLQVDTLPFPQMVEVISPDGSPATLKPGESVRFFGRWLAKGRGRHSIPALRCVSAFPFGLWSWGCSQKRYRRLLVYPRFTPLTQVSLRIGEMYQPEGESLSNKPGLSMEFLGCREFRDGDDLRRLHMRSWARAGVPVVKEFRQEYMARAGIVLDTYLPRRMFEEIRERFEPRPIFESELSLAAALVDFFASHDCRIDLFAAGSVVHHFGGSHGTEYLSHVLDIMAALDFSTKDDFSELGEKLAPYVILASGMVFVLCNWNEARENVIEEIRASGVECLVVLVTRGKKHLKGLPGYIHQVPGVDIQGGRCTVL